MKKRRGLVSHLRTTGAGRVFTAKTRLHTVKPEGTGGQGGRGARYSSELCCSVLSVPRTTRTRFEAAAGGVRGGARGSAFLTRSWGYQCCLSGDHTLGSESIEPA